MAAATDTSRRLKRDAVVTCVLVLCLCAATLALVWVNVSIGNHAFTTGAIDINLNDGEPVIQEDDLVLEPGMQVEKSFFIQNDGSWDVYYKLYLDDVSGGLADSVVVTIEDGDETLYSGVADRLTRADDAAVDTALAAGERRVLTATFELPEGSGNESQGSDLTFVLCADATQTKNNPDKAFE